MRLRCGGTWVCWWKNFENLSTFGKVVRKSRMSRFLNWLAEYIAKVTRFYIRCWSAVLSALRGRAGFTGSWWADVRAVCAGGPWSRGTCRVLRAAPYQCRLAYTQHTPGTPPSSLHQRTALDNNHILTRWKYVAGSENVLTPPPKKEVTFLSFKTVVG